MEDYRCGFDEERCVLRVHKFSVLMSLYKGEKPEFLRASLDSILSQTLLPNEILLVKDGLLTHELEKVLSEYTNKSNIFRFLSFEENRGLGLALRDGVLACSYEYIARMDTDDIAKSDRFEKQLMYLGKHPEIAMVGSWVTEFSTDPLKPDTFTKLPCDHIEIVKFAKQRNPFRHMTVIYKKSSVLDSGNYRNFLWFEDYDLWVRMIQKGYKMANIPEVLVNVRADRNMFARRGGWNYLKQDIKFQKLLFNTKFTNIKEYLFNILIRSVVRIIPNRLRISFYRYLLRK